MPPPVNLPTPAAGDIFTHDGNLKVTNAAANVFVVYNFDAKKADPSPSSLTVDFVMGNVYLIDASLCSYWESNRVFGNLVKGLGLPFEGWFEGNNSIDTVYDDIPPSVTTSYVYGCRLLESHLSYGGGLQRARSAWASMTFAPVRPSSLPTRGLPPPLQNSTSGTSHTAETSFMDCHGAPGFRKAEQEEKKLRRGVDESISRVISGRATATVEKGPLSVPNLYTQQTDKDPAIQLDGISDSSYPRLMCANCCRGGHEAKDCIGPVDIDGFIAACPICNVRDHIFSSCSKLLETKKKGKRALQFLYLVQHRQNKPPILATTCWIAVWAAQDCPRISLPHTKEFARMIGQGLIPDYPDWRTYDYSAPLSPRDSTNVALLRDPSTEYEYGRPSSLFPGTQGISIGQGYNAVRAKMQRLGINLLPNAPNPAVFSRKMKKQAKRDQVKRDQVKRDHTRTTLVQGDGSRFATGANCTIVQKSLPALPAKPVFTSPTIVNIKQEAID
ncbi:zinc finger protein [Colletotrichum scovillei]|nr:zinc finger protein [Colletotrichum scovillei]KAH8421689.1 zinc finger protein [Colletotrichum scovillei]KAH8421846.1 zinc finger protein [Colletotrichum scovillei]